MNEFAQIIAEHKSTIYTVCYMFSQEAVCILMGYLTATGALSS